MANHALPLAPGQYTQEAVDQIKRDSSQEAFPPSRAISRSTIFRSRVVANKKKHSPSKAGNK